MGERLPITIHHRYLKVRTEYPVLNPASLRDRIMAQLIDGILLGIISGIFLALYSRGQIFSLWISPMIPVYLIQVVPGYIPSVWDWWWGGYFLTVSLPWVADFNLAFPSLLQWVFYAAYYTWFHSRMGQTPGKMMKGLVVLTHHGRFVTPGTAFLRWLGYVVSIIPFGWGFWSMSGSPEGHSWHDRLTGTRVYRFLDQSS